MLQEIFCRVGVGEHAVRPIGEDRRVDQNVLRIENDLRACRLERVTIHFHVIVDAIFVRRHPQHSAGQFRFRCADNREAISVYARRDLAALS